MLAIDRSSTMMWGATAITPATASGCSAALMSAIEPPSLCPKSHGRVPSRPTLSAASTRGSVSRASTCMKSGVQRSACGRGVERPYP
jgi:hypothetical protein